MLSLCSCSVLVVFDSKSSFEDLQNNEPLLGMVPSFCVRTLSELAADTITVFSGFSTHVRSDIASSCSLRYRRLIVVRRRIWGYCWGAGKGAAAALQQSEPPGS